MDRILNHGRAAEGIDVLWMVLREAFSLVSIGVAAAVPTALAITHLASSRLSGLLFGLEATDPTTITVASLLLLSVALVVSHIPARRASQMDPMVALRYE